jgi:hypothetical protein
MRQQRLITTPEAAAILRGGPSVPRPVRHRRHPATEGGAIYGWVIAATLAALALAGPASAQDTSPDGDGVFAARSIEQDTAGGLTPSCGGGDPAVSVAAGWMRTSSSTVYCSDGSVAKCDGKKFWVGLKNIHGAVLWRYYIGVQWCWNRGKVTKVRFNRWPQITGWGELYGWQFVGHLSWSGYPNYIEPGRTYYPRTTSSSAHGVGKFRRCIQIGVAYCWGERYGRLDVVVYGNGGYGYDSNA